MEWTMVKPPIALRASPSLLYNNASSNGEDVVYVCKNEVYKVNANGQTASMPHEDKFPIQQVRWCPVKGATHLVVVNTNGVQVWDEKMTQMLFFYPVTSVVSNDPSSHHFRGICCDDGHIFVGCSSGDIVVLKASGNKLSRSNVDPSVNSAVCCMDCDGAILAVGDELGTITLFDVNQDVEKETTFALGNGFPCSAVAIRHSKIFASYGSGHVRIVDLRMGCMTVEIAAHSRCIMALSLHPSKDMFASVGDDTVLNVFSYMGDGEQFEVELGHSERVENMMLTGVDFLDNGDIAATAFDDNSLRMWVAS